MHPSHLTLLFGTPTRPRTLTVEITAALHMASLVDAYRSHSGCSLPLNPPPACEGPPLEHCPGYESTHPSSVVGLWLAGRTSPSHSIGVVPAGRP
jgi:hypothetical protein